MKLSKCSGLATFSVVWMVCTNTAVANENNDLWHLEKTSSVLMSLDGMNLSESCKSAVNQYVTGLIERKLERSGVGQQSEESLSSIGQRAAETRAKGLMKRGDRLWIASVCSSDNEHSS
jgi:hypothetical protein